MSNHLLREFGMGLGGQGIAVLASGVCPTACRSRRSQCVVGERRMITGGCSVFAHGTWSELVEGGGVSHERTR